MAAARVRPTRQRRGRRGRHRLEPRRAPRTLGSSIDPISWSPMVGRSPGHRQSAGEARNALHFQIWNCNCINRLAGRSLRRNAGRCRTVQDRAGLIHAKLPHEFPADLPGSRSCPNDGVRPKRTGRLSGSS